MLQELKPLPYHEAIRAYLQEEEPEVWNWFASHRVRNERCEAVRFELLKSTYRVDPHAKPDWYEAARQVASRLGLDLPITIYQAQEPAGLNASLACIPGEAHLVLHGPVAATLDAVEFRALLGHELSHQLLWQGWDGEYLIVDQVLAALTNDPRAEGPHFASARLFGLYTEIFCDRGAVLVSQGPLPVVAMLVKVTTGVTDVSAEAYLRQAEEILSRGGGKAAELTHPEAYLRARAVQLWSERGEEADAETRAMIEGAPTLDELDLLGQRQAAAWTRRLIDALLSRPWLQTESTVAHARLFFDGYVPPSTAVTDPQLAEAVQAADGTLRDYYCYVLLDFVTAARELDELPLAAALTLAEQMELKDRFGEIAKRELRLRKNQLERIDEQKDALLAGVKERIDRS